MPVNKSNWWKSEVGDLLLFSISNLRIKLRLSMPCVPVKPRRFYHQPHEGVLSICAAFTFNRLVVIHAVHHVIDVTGA